MIELKGLNYAILCETKDIANEVLDLYNKYRLANNKNKSILTVQMWENYKERTCYDLSNIKTNGYCSKHWFITHGWEILDGKTFLEMNENLFSEPITQFKIGDLVTQIDYPYEIVLIVTSSNVDQIIFQGTLLRTTRVDSILKPGYNGKFSSTQWQKVNDLELSLKLKWDE